MTQHLSFQAEAQGKIIPTLLVHIEFFNFDTPDLHELEELAATAKFHVVTTVLGRRDQPDAKFFIGSGKVQELKDLKNLHEIKLIIFNHDLSPSQERNLEKELECQVMSRTGLILEIFSQRARTHEGKLQVQLAQLEYQSTRLVRGWTHLERQRGGIGVRGGPGETQLEIDKRLIRKQIKKIKTELEKVKTQRQLGRSARKKSNIPTISLVGYTNAGKSTLFNRLTHADVYVANQLFATLDPSIRKVTVPYFGEAYLADTVGFIRNLPHDLVEAFHATLVETIEADLLLHVIDVANPDYELQREQVLAVLAEIKASDRPILEVMNKIDLKPQTSAHIKQGLDQKPGQVFISAAKNMGVDLLWQAIAERLGGPIIEQEIILRPDQGAHYAQLQALKVIQSECSTEAGEWLIKVRAVKNCLSIFN
jgi:GTP-binding protein HflX